MILFSLCFKLYFLLYLTFYCLLSTLVASNTQCMNIMSQKLGQRLLDVTNLIKIYLGSGIAGWNSKLAVQVQQYANTCPGFRHGGPDGYQNLAFQGPVCQNTNDCNLNLTASWLFFAKEIKLWNYNTRSCKTGNWEDCGHLTNAFSPSMFQMGCGASKRVGDTKSYVYCNYIGSVKDPVLGPVTHSLNDIEKLILNKNSWLWKRYKKWKVYYQWKRYVKNRRYKLVGAKP